MNVPVPAVPPASRLPAHPGGAAFAAREPQLLEPLGFQVSEEQKLELLEYWRSILKRKWLILGLGLVAAVVAAVVSLAIAPSFQSTATVLIEAGKGKILSFDDIYAGAQQREHYQTQVEILKSREVAERTVRALELWKHPGYDPRKAAPGLRARAAEWLGIGREEHEFTWTIGYDADFYGYDVGAIWMFHEYGAYWTQAFYATLEGDTLSFGYTYYSSAYYYDYYVYSYSGSGTVTE